MNVLICVTALSYAMGGVSTHILDLCKGYSMSDEITKVFVCCEEGELVNRLNEIPKVKYIFVPFDSWGMNLSSVIKETRVLCKIIKKEKIDIVHVHSQRIIFAAHLAKIICGVPYLWTNHIDAIPNASILKMMCTVFRFPIISVSQALKDLMVEQYHCDKNNVFVVNNGTDLSDLTPLKESEKDQLEHLYSIDRRKTPYVICLLSRVQPVKGHEQLLKAVNASVYKNKIKVIFAGHTYPHAVEYRKNLLKYAHENQIDLKFLEYSKPREVFGVADLFVLPSIYEGFALVCIEALAMGCAVIRTRTPGWHEMQEWVEIVEKNDLEGLTKCINKVIDNGFNEQRTSQGKIAVQRLFTKEICTQKTITVYRNIIKATH